MKGLHCIICTSLLILFGCSSSKQFIWTEETSSKSELIGLTKDEVIILASIVEKETKVASEQSKIARVYLNRLNNAMPLQSDPTIMYIIGDSSVKRIASQHLTIDSPYNTYKYKGLPPGPICKPSKKTILAVLNADNNDYLYFCRKPDYTEYFNYAETMKVHRENTKLFLEALKKPK